MHYDLLAEVSEVRAMLLLYRDKLKNLCEEMAEKKIQIKHFDSDNCDFSLESVTPLGFIDTIKRDEFQ